MANVIRNQNAIYIIVFRLCKRKWSLAQGVSRIMDVLYLTVLLLTFWPVVNTNQLKIGKSTNEMKGFPIKDWLVLLTDSLESIKTKASIYGLRNANTTGKIEIQVLEVNDTWNERQLCERFQSHAWSPFLLDISQSNLGKTVARKMGIPSLRATNQATRLAGWKNLNEIEENIFVSILTPEAIILHMIKDIANQYNYKSIVVIYDRTFRKCWSFFCDKFFQILHFG